MALGYKHAKLSFSGWRGAPDARKPITLKRQWGPGMVGDRFFASPALLIQENPDLLTAIETQRHDEAVHNVGRRLPKTEPEQRKT